MTCKKYFVLFAVLTSAVLASCGSISYGLTSTSIPDNIKTFQVDFFTNEAAIVEPGIDLTFRQELQNLILDQTSLSLVNTNGDYIYQGEIMQYYIAPMTATADNLAAQNRVTIDINVRFINTKIEEESFEKRYSFFYDYDANTQLQGAALDTALEVIYDQITQDIFNDTLSKW